VSTVAYHDAVSDAVFISIDMEGIAGITTLRQTSRGTDDYEWGRRLMTEEANAAVAGAFDAGVKTVVVSDSHGDMGNLLPADLDPRAELVQGTPKVPWSMMSGLDESFTCAAFLGYHAGAGTELAILDHTMTGFIIDVRVNGDTWNETHLNAALAGTFGVPVVFVAGDRACCDQARAKLPWVKTVAVKEGHGNRSGRSQSPERARAAIRGMVREAVKQVEQAQVWRPAGPYVLEMEFSTTAVADMCSLVPFTERNGPRTTRFETDDLRTLYRCMLSWVRPAPVTSTGASTGNQHSNTVPPPGALVTRHHPPASSARSNVVGNPM
jgi:D-amino peptidase